MGETISAYAPPSDNVARSQIQPEPSQTRATTWGIELELVFTFHRSRLQKILDQYPENRRPKIVPDENAYKHLIVQQTHELDEFAPQKTWPTWLVAVPMNIKTLETVEKVCGGIPWYAAGPEQRISPCSTEGEIHRPYVLEALLVAQDALGERGLPARVIGSRTIVFNSSSLPEIFNEVDDDAHLTEEHYKCFPHLEPVYQVTHRKDFTFDGWLLTKDLTVFPATSSEMQSALGLTKSEINEWSSDGIELISPVFAYGDLDGGCKQIERYLQQLKHAQGVPDNTTAGGISITQSKDWSPRTWGTIHSIRAGTHVHIGLKLGKPKGKRIYDENFLRHLIFVITSNERLISTLHPLRRRGVGDRVSPIEDVFPPPKTDRSRSLAAIDETYKQDADQAEIHEKWRSVHNMLKNEHVLPGWAGGNDILSATKRWNQLANAILDPNRSIQSVFESVQSVRDKPRALYHGMLVDYARVAAFLGLPYFGHSLAFPPPCTIEFRQMGCTLDADEIKHWVKFLFALVRLAERRADATTSFRERSSVDTQSDFGDLDPSNLLTLAARQEADKYPGSITTIESLCGPDNLDLPHEEVLYWTSRARRLAAEEQVSAIRTEFRHHRRRRAKARYGLPLSQQETAAEAALHETFMKRHPSHDPRAPFAAMTKVQLLGHLCERFSIAKSSRRKSETDQKKFRRLQGMRKESLIRMAVETDENLRGKGLYVPDGQADEVGLLKLA